MHSKVMYSIHFTQNLTLAYPNQYGKHSTDHSHKLEDICPDYCSNSTLQQFAF